MSAENATFNYIITLLPQLITIVAAIGGGFKALQRQNEKKIREAKDDILARLDVEKDSIAKDMKGIAGGIANLDNQYKIITGFIKEQLERHDRMIDRLDEKNTGRFGGPQDIERR